METPRGIFCPDWFPILDACSPGPARTWSGEKGPVCREGSSASWGLAAEAKASLGPGRAWAEVRTTQLRKNISWLPAGPGFCAKTGLVTSAGWLGFHSSSWGLWAAGASPQPSRRPVRTLPGSLDKQPFRHDSHDQGHMFFAKTDNGRTPRRGVRFSTSLTGVAFVRMWTLKFQPLPAPGHVSSPNPSSFGSRAPSAPEQRL